VLRRLRATPRWPFLRVEEKEKDESFLDLEGVLSLNSKNALLCVIKFQFFVFQTKSVWNGVETQSKSFCFWNFPPLKCCAYFYCDSH